MAMGEAENPEITWTVQVVAPTEIHMMVTVRHDSMIVMTTDTNCGTKKSCTNYQPNQTIDYQSPATSPCTFFPLTRENRISGSLFKLFFFPFATTLTCTPSCVFSCYSKYDHWLFNKKLNYS